MISHHASKFPVRHPLAAGPSRLPVGGPCIVEVVRASEACRPVDPSLPVVRPGCLPMLLMSHTA